MTDSFPLKWPTGRQRTSDYARKHAAFKVTRARARDGLLHELKLLGASNVVISSNVATYRRGNQDIMYADQTAVDKDPGVAVYYTWKNEQYSLACDKWKDLTDNLQSLAKTIEAIRGIERWGTGEMMRAAFSGFKELPSSTMAEFEVWQTLGISEGRPRGWAHVEQAYKAMAMKAHPDRPGGSNAAFVKLQEAYTLAKKVFGVQ